MCGGRVLLNHIRLLSILLLSLRLWRTSVMGWVKTRCNASAFLSAFSSFWLTQIQAGLQLNRNNFFQPCPLPHVESLYAFRVSFWEILGKGSSLSLNGILWDSGPSCQLTYHPVQFGRLLTQFSLPHLIILPPSKATIGLFKLGRACQFLEFDLLELFTCSILG